MPTAVLNCHTYALARAKAILHASHILSYPISQPNPHLPLQAHNKKSVKTLGAGPLLSDVRGVLGILKKKQSKPNKHLDAAREEPPSTTVVDDRTVLPPHGVGEGDMDTTVKVCQRYFLCRSPYFSLRLVVAHSLITLTTVILASHLIYFLTGWRNRGSTRS